MQKSLIISLRTLVKKLSNHLTSTLDVDIPNFVYSMFFFPTTKREVETITDVYEISRPREMT